MNLNRLPRIRVGRVSIYIGYTDNVELINVYNCCKYNRDVMGWSPEHVDIIKHGYVSDFIGNKIEFPSPQSLNEFCNDR